MSTGTTAGPGLLNGINLSGLAGLSLTGPLAVSSTSIELGTPPTGRHQPLGKEQRIPKTVQSSRCPVYLDIETIPDESRRHLFGLDEPKEPKPESNPVVTDYAGFMKQSVATLKEIVEAHNPSDVWLTAFETWERNSPKPRSTVLDIVKSVRSSRTIGPEAEAAKIKKMGLTPEMLKIVSIAIAIGDDAPQGFVVDEHIGGTVTEVDLLEWTWQSIREATSIVGFNILGFDMPGILTRSSILKVTPTRSFSTKPWDNDVIDLMVRRWPKGGQLGLKQAAKCMGIAVPVEDMDGSKVYETFQRDPFEVLKYNMSDVVITRELKRMWSGYFL